MNNYEKIKSISVDEMAEFFIKHKLSCRSVIRHNTEPCSMPTEICTPKECFKQWLLAEVEE